MIARKAPAEDAGGTGTQRWVLSALASAPGDRSVSRSDPAAEVVADIPDHSAAEPCGRPMTPGEALVKLFIENADHGRNAANDDLVMALRQRAREIQALGDSCPPGTTPHPHEMPDNTLE